MRISKAAPGIFQRQETLGHFAKTLLGKSEIPPAPLAPRRSAHRQRISNISGLTRLAEKYEFVAFEAAQKPLRRAVGKIRTWCPALRT